MLAGGLEDRMSGVRDEGKTWEPEERAAGVTTTSCLPLRPFWTSLLTLVLLPAQSSQVGLWTPFTIRTQASLRHEEEWAGVGGVMEKQKH